MATAFLLFALSFYLKRKKHLYWPSLVVMVLVLAGLVVHNTVGTKVAMGIVATTNTYIMDGPSPGASVVSVIQSGHRVEIVGKKDVWIKIMWQGETAYIKENNLLPLSL